MYVKPEHRLTSEQLDQLVDNLPVDTSVPLEVIIQVDYVFHAKDENYDGGLSFLDRLYKALSYFYELSWDVDAIKKMIRESSNPQEEYYNFLREALTQDMIDSYGV